MQLKELDISAIKPAKYNPKDRVTKGISKLEKSISELGIHTPLSVISIGNNGKTNYHLIDGHRRIAAAKNLGMSKVPCVISDAEDEKIIDRLYFEVNDNSMKLSGANQLEIYLKGGMISKRIQQSIEALKEIGGRPLLDLMLNERVNPLQIWRAYTDLTNYMPVPWVEETLEWLVTKRMAWAVRRAIEEKIPSAKIKQAIRSNKPLKKTW